MYSEVKFVWIANEGTDIDEKYQKSGDDPIFYGLPHTKQYPMPDEKHVRSAIRFFNYVSSEDEEELARNINKMIKKFNIKDLNVGPTNRFKNYYKGSEESVMTNTSPIVPYGRRLKKPAVESSWMAKTYTDMKLLPVYIMLSYSYTGTGTLIKLFTHAPYSHATLFFDSSLQKGYSFATRDGHTMIRYGFTTESINKLVSLNNRAYYAIYVVFVSPAAYKKMQKNCIKMNKTSYMYRYDFAGAIQSLSELTKSNEIKYFCSNFVAMILNSGDSKLLNKPYQLYKPMDISSIGEAHLIDMGLAKDYNKAYVDKETLYIYNRYYARKVNYAEKASNIEIV